MNKAQIIAAVAAESNISKKDAGSIIDSFLNNVGESLKSDQEVSIFGFGTFKVTERSARIGRNPKTGEDIQIAAKKVVSFKPMKALKDKVA